MDAPWEDLLVHSDFVSFIVKNGLLKLTVIVVKF